MMLKMALYINQIGEIYMNKPNYDYEITASNGNRYGYIIKDSHVVVYINDKEWGSPQGNRFIKVLLEELIKKEKDQT